MESHGVPESQSEFRPASPHKEKRLEKHVLDNNDDIWIFGCYLMLFLKLSKHMKTTTEIAAVSNQGILDAASTALRPSESLVLAYLGHVTRNLAITFNFAIFGYLLSKSFQESLSLASGRS